MEKGKWMTLTLKRKDSQTVKWKSDRVSFQRFHLLISSQFLRHSFLRFSLHLFFLISFPSTFHFTLISHSSLFSSPSLSPFWPQLLFLAGKTNRVSVFFLHLYLSIFYAANPRLFSKAKHIEKANASL